MLEAIVVSLSLLQPPPSACRADEAAVEAVRRVATGIVEADNARDLERVMAAYAPDAWLLPPNERPIQGHAAIRPRYEALFAGFTPAIDGQVDELCVTGAAAFVRGRNGGRLVSRSAAPTRELHDAYVMLLKVDAGGHWRISHLIWHAMR